MQRLEQNIRAKYVDTKKTLDINESNLKVTANFPWQVH